MGGEKGKASVAKNAKMLKQITKLLEEWKQKVSPVAKDSKQVEAAVKEIDKIQDPENPKQVGSAFKKVAAAIKNAINDDKRKEPKVVKAKTRLGQYNNALTAFAEGLMDGTYLKELPVNTNSLSKEQYN